MTCCGVPLSPCHASLAALPTPGNALCCTPLQTLCLDFIPSHRGCLYAFDTEALVAKLPHLETLALVGWGEADLAGLPCTLRTLVVRGHGFEYCEMEGPLVAEPKQFALPEGHRCAIAGGRRSTVAC